MAEAKYTPRLKRDYDERIVPAMIERFGYKNRLQVPRLEKIVINMGVGESTADSKKASVAAADARIAARESTTRFGTPVDPEVSISSGSGVSRRTRWICSSQCDSRASTRAGRTRAWLEISNFGPDTIRPDTSSRTSTVGSKSGPRPLRSMRRGGMRRHRETAEGCLSEMRGPIRTKQVEVLTELLNRNSKNSHLPPSSDGPGSGSREARAARNKRKAERKRGAQLVGDSFDPFRGLHHRDSDFESLEVILERAALLTGVEQVEELAAIEGGQLDVLLLGEVDDRVEAERAVEVDVQLRLRHVDRFRLEPGTREHPKPLAYWPTCY